MFSGIIQKIAPIVSIEMTRGCRRVRIARPRGWKLTNGQSVAVDGICSTVAARLSRTFDVEYMPETLSKTTAASFAKGKLVNLERSLALDSLIDGHILQGHVDARGRIAGIVEAGISKEMTIAVPRVLMKFIPPHGSIAINGVSLTIAREGRSSFTVALIPYTLAHTNLRFLDMGDEVNIETDMITRYLFTMLDRGRVNRDAKKRVRKKS